MRFSFDGCDAHGIWLVPINAGSNYCARMDRLCEGERLERELYWVGENDKLGKLVSLELAEVNAGDGLEVEYLPKDASWEEVQRIQVKISEEAFQLLRERSAFKAKYDDNLVEIYYDIPMF